MNDFEKKKLLKDKLLSRISFTEITPKAIEDAIKSPREIDQNLVDAYLARRILDHLIGFKVSPFLAFLTTTVFPIIFLASKICSGCPILCIIKLLTSTTQFIGERPMLCKRFCNHLGEGLTFTPSIKTPPIPSPPYTNAPVELNVMMTSAVIVQITTVSMNGSSAAEVAELLAMIKNAGMPEPKSMAVMAPAGMSPGPIKPAGSCGCEGMEEDTVEEDHANEPDEMTMDTAYMTKDLAGGMNRPKPKGALRAKDPAIHYDDSIKENLNHSFL